MSSLKKLHLLAKTDSADRLDAWEQLLLDIGRSISLPESRYAKLEGHYTAISGLLLDPKDPELTDLLIFPQGSVQTRTLVRPLPGCEADVDAIAFREKGTRLTPREWLDRLLAELEARARTQGGVKRKRRCVTVSYDDKELPAHVDVTPAVPTLGNNKDDGTGPLEVPDYPSNKMSPTNPKDFADWVKQASEETLPLRQTTIRLVEDRAKAEVESMPTHADMIALDPLRLAIKVAKRHRDIYARANKCEEHQPISVVITTMITKAFLAFAAEARRVGRELTMIEALREIVARMPAQLDRTGHGQWLLSNPRRPTENFVEKWNTEPGRADVFFAWHTQLKQAVDLGLYNFSDREDFVQAVEEAFGLEPRRATDKRLVEAAKAGKELPGLAPATAARLRHGEAAAATLLGLASTTPARAQQPQDLGRLG